MSLGPVADAAPGPPPPPDRQAEGARRTLRWLLALQVALAIVLVAVDIGPSLPGRLAPSDAPALDAPVRPGDQTRRYAPREGVPLPGRDGDMPRRLVAVAGEIGGRPGLRLSGGIAPGDGERIADTLRARRPAVVALDSPGGSVFDALAVGRALREIGADTVLEDGAVCLSACPYAFAGGVARLVGEARLGVHQHSFGESTVLPAFLAVEDIQRGQAAVLEHLGAMGVDLRLMGPAMATPADEIYILTPEELREWDVVTAEAG